MTKIIKLNPKKLEKEKIAEAVKVIKAGGVVVFPTETVYGLGCSPWSLKAVKKIFKLKGRLAKKPLAIIVENFKQVRSLVKNLNPKALDLMSKHWPGPMTLVLPKSRRIPDYVTSGSKKIGIRMPDHPITLELLRACKIPLVATSANRSGSIAPATARAAFRELKGVDLVIDGGKTSLGKASTVIDITSGKPKILRKGSLKIKI